MGKDKHCPFCKTHDGTEVMLIPMPVEFSCLYRCVSCGAEFDQVPEPTAEEWLESIESAEAELTRRKVSRVFGRSLYTGRDECWDSNDLEFRSRK